MSYLIRALLLMVSIGVLASCGITKGKEAAAKSVDLFHQQFNDSKFTEIYSTSSPAFKSAAPEADFMKFIQAVHSKLGTCQSSVQNGWRTNATTSGTFVVLTQNSVFEKGSAVETFTFVVSGETATLQGYNVNSPALITN